MKNDSTKSPRLYVANDLREGESFPLSKDHAHYLLAVMRKGKDDIIRVFNGRDGEFTGTLSPTSKKAGDISSLQKIKNQPEDTDEIHLYFAPIKKDRLQFLVEKAVELGVTHLHPVITDHTENRKPNIDKVQTYAIEATEQCERMTLPTLHPIKNINAIDFYAPTFAAIERDRYEVFSSTQASLGILIGPEGGWSENEKTQLMDQANIRPVSLGDNILRAETAALFMLSRIAK